MGNKTRVVYFGAAGAGLAYCHHTNTQPDLFVDNDQSKWGTSINGVKVESPEILTALDLERLVITSGYIKDILPQILNLGVAKDLIEIPPRSLFGLHPFEIEENRVLAANKLFEIMSHLDDKWSVVTVGGVALGFVRGGDFIHWDTDIDSFAPIQARPALIDLLSKLGCEPVEEEGAVMHTIDSTLHLENGIDISFSIDFFDGESETFIDRFEDYSWEWPTSMFTQCAKVEVHGNMLNVPNPPAEYLSKVYGATWAEPNQDFSYEDYEGEVEAK